MYRLLFWKQQLILQGIQHWSVTFESAKKHWKRIRFCEHMGFFSRKFDIHALILQKSQRKWQKFSFEKKIPIFLGQNFFWNFFEIFFFTINQPKKEFKAKKKNFKKFQKKFYDLKGAVWLALRSSIWRVGLQWRFEIWCF